VGGASDETFGHLLVGLRLDRGLSQEDLADRSGMSVRAIRYLECGRVLRPRRHSVSLLADALALADAERTAFTQLARRAGPHVQPRPVAPGQLPPGQLLPGQPPPGQVRRAFRLLGLLDAADFAPWMLAALLGVPATQAEAIAERLRDAESLNQCPLCGSGYGH
jgi:transcriptional regulator with XRE-family HTH domain